MTNQITIRCKNNNKLIDVELGSTLRDVYEKTGILLEESFLMRPVR